MTGRGKRSQKLQQNSELAALRASVTDGLPPGAERQGAVGVPVSGAGKGKKGRIVVKSGEFVPTDHIVEHVRTLLADNWTVGDIKRQLALKFGGKGASFAKHVALARKRNLASLGRTPQEAKSDSTQQWTRMLAEERQNRTRAAAAVESALARLDLLKAEYDAATNDKRAVALERIETQLAFVDRCERRLMSARQAIERHQHTIDRILGNHAPIEYKDMSEKKAELANPTEPLTDKESDARLAELLGKLRGEVKTEVSTPSAN